MGPGNRSRGDISGGMSGETENPSSRGDSPYAIALPLKAEVGAERRVGGVREADEEKGHRSFTINAIWGERAAGC